MTEELTPPAVPASHVAFAKAIADVAAAHGIERFEMTFRPAWRRDVLRDMRINGDLRIVFADVDGRGRPCRNLSIRMDASLTLPIESNGESSD